MATLLHDARFAFRLLRKSPAFTLVAVATLALAIAANTVVFTGVDAVLLQPLPYAQPDQLARVYSQFPKQDLMKFSLSDPEYFDLTRETRAFESLGAWAPGRANFTGGDRPLAVPQAVITASLLPTLGVRPILGRGFAEGEDRPNGPELVLVSYDMWQRSFGGSADVLGRTVQVDGVTTTIIGVMPKGFDFPGNGAQIWSLLSLDPNDVSHRGSHNLNVVARMRPGVTLESANADLKDLTIAWSTAHPKEHFPDPVFHPLIARSLKAEIIDSTRELLWVMQGVVFFVLLIACANISNLLVARADARRGEIATRMALGASRWRLARQFLVESLVLGLCGAAIGILVTPWALDALIALLPENTPRATEIRIDFTVLAFAVAIAVLASLVFGLAPMLHTRTTALLGALSAAAQRATGSRHSVKLRRALIVAEVALATVLVVGAGLFARSFFALQRVDVGFERDHLATFRVFVPEANMKDDPQLVRFYDDLRARLGELPGVDAVALMYAPPPHRQANDNDIFFPGRTPDPKGPVWNVDYWQFVMGDDMKALGRRLVAGRTLEPSDDERQQRVALVNEAFVRKFWPGEEAVGKHVRVDSEDPDITIVGVAADVKYAGLDQPSGTEIVFPVKQADIDSKYAQGQGVPRSVTFLLRTHGDPRAIFASVRTTVAAVAPTIPVSRLQTMEDAVEDDIAQPRFLTSLVLGFAAIALLMAAVGVYGVMSYSVMQRSHEIGIRMALGAPPGKVLGMLVRQGLTLAAVGSGLGLAMAIALQRVLARTISSLLFGPSALDLAMLAAVAIPLVGVALVACFLPAYRAARIRPLIAMRIET